MAKKVVKKKKSRKKLTDQEKEKNSQMREIRNLISKIGFSRVPRIDGKEFVYDGRTSELDDIFYFENVVILAEYTIAKSVGTHLLKKKIIYDKINANIPAFFKFLFAEEKFKTLKETFDTSVLSKYSINQLQVRILYASKNSVEKEHKDQLPEKVKFFDYHIVKYFERIAKTIKKSTKHEFFDFLKIDYSKIGENIKSSSLGSSDEFLGHILPEEHSSFKEGYKLVSFYIDADSLIRRAYVLRNDGWKNKENIGLYQRMFVGTKIGSMRKYLHTEQRVFINNVIVTLPIEKLKLLDNDDKELEVDEEGNFLNSDNTKVQPAKIKIENEANIIGIIDGQHRAFAYHEGDDVYEKSISELRKIQNLLVTGILYPKNEKVEKRLKFEAKLFLEINANQSGASSQLKQQIEFMLNPFSTVSISKHIINKLNESGPLGTLFEEYWYEKSKIKTASIISFGLKPLVKFEETDSLYKIWKNPDKEKLKSKDEDFDLLLEYKEFCVEEIRSIFKGLKRNIDNNNWKVDRTDKEAILNVTTINGIINCLRLLVQNDKTGNDEYYIEKFSKINEFPFKEYKSSQYRKMGQDIYDRYFN